MRRSSSPRRSAPCAPRAAAGAPSRGAVPRPGDARSRGERPAGTWARSGPAGPGQMIREGEGDAPPQGADRDPVALLEHDGPVAFVAERARVVAAEGLDQRGLAVEVHRVAPGPGLDPVDADRATAPG